MNNRRDIAQEFADKINSEDIKQIVLFGSVARGEDCDDSDIDILIVSNKGKEIEPKIASEVFNVVLNKKEFISAHVMSENKLNKIKDFSLLKNINKEGIILG